MSKTSIADMDIVVANNTDVNAVGIQGSDTISSGDNALRSYAALLARFYDSLGGVNTVGGTASAITATITEDWTAYATGMVLAIKAASASTGATTLNVTPSVQPALGVKKIRKQGDSAIAANDMVANGVYLLRYDAAYDTAAGAWILLNPASSAGTFAANSDALAATSAILNLNPANLAQERALGIQPVNLGLASSVGSSALTIALKGIDGNDPSATDPVTVPFRNVTSATGTPSYLTVTAATSLVISSGSTMGFTSAVQGRLWIVAFNDAGTFRLGAVNCLSGQSIMSLRNGIASSTAEGGAGAADSAQVIYTGSAVASKAFTVLGYLEATEATAGTWATAPSLIKLFQPGDAMPCDTIQVRTSIDSTVASGTTTLPSDNTIPQSGEGDQYMSQVITPVSASNLIYAEHEATYTNSAQNNMTAAIFVDAGADAITAHESTITINTGTTIRVATSILAGTTSAKTFKVRAGGSAAGTTRFNGFNGAQVYGGVAGGLLRLTEIMA